MKKKKKYEEKRAPKKTLGFSLPMFSLKDDLLAEEYAEKAAKRMNEALSDEEE
jgi:hypothetical protein